jgi:type I restriction enzyme, S subunit
VNSEFQIKTFDEILLKIIGGGTPSKAVDSYWDGDIPWVSVKDMTDKMIYLDSTQDFITREGLKNSSSNLIKSNSIIISTRMGLGRCFINKVEMAINQDLKALIPNEEIVDKYYLFYFLKFKAEYLISIGSGTTVKGIRLEDLKKIEILLPSIKTQQKIVNLISNYDNLIENNNKRIKLLENMAEELYKEWFVRLRFPNYQNTKIVDGIPDGWENNTISEIATFINGYAFKSDDFNDKGNSSIIKIKNIDNNTIDIINVDKVEDVITKKISNKFKISENDLLIAMTGATVGKVGLMPIADGDFFLNQRVGKIESKYKYFILSELKSCKGQSNINNLAAGAAQPNISSEQILGIKTLIPDENLLIKFENIVKEIYLDILFLNFKNQNLKETRDLLLPRLISGKLDIKDLHIV